MKIDLDKICDTFDIDLDEYMKFIITNIYWESIDECKPITYKLQDNKLYIPNNFFFIAFHARPASKIEKPTKIIIGGKKDCNNLFFIQAEIDLTKYYNNIDFIYNFIKEQINIANAKYPDTITPYKIKEIIYQLPLGLMIHDNEEDDIEDDFDREVF